MQHTLRTCALFGLAVTAAANASTLDFTTVDYPAIDEDQTIVVSDDGVNFTFDPINNLVGAPRWIGDDKIHFGGGGGSTLEFDFFTDTDVTLDTYTIGDIFHLGNPDFQIRQGGDVLSASNDADVDGTFGFDGGAISLTANTTYTFENNTVGAGIQSAFTAWEFTVVPEPSTFSLLGFAALAIVRRR